MSTMNWFDTEKPLSEVTVKELDALCDSIVAQRAKCDEIKSQLKEESACLSELETKLAAYLNEFGKTSYKTSAGTFSLVKLATVRVPQTEEDRSKFFAYLKEKGIFDRMITVNSQTLNAWYRQELEIARSEGTPLEIPGLGEVSVYETVRFSKGR